MSQIDELAKLAELRDKGVLNPEEFEIKKKQLLAGGSPTSAGRANHVSLKNSATGEIKEIKIGWSWPLFCLTWFFGLPLFLRRLWVPAMGNAIIAVFVFYSWMFSFGLIDPRLMLAQVLVIVSAFYWAIRGNKLTAKNYLKKGWVFAEPESESARQAKQAWKLT